MSPPKVLPLILATHLVKFFCCGFSSQKIKNCSSPEKLNMYVDLFWFFKTYLCDEERNSLEEITPMTKNTFDIRWKRTTKTQTSILKMTSQLWPKIIIGGISASQFFLRSESEQEFKWFTVKRQASNWLTGQPIKGPFFGGKPSWLWSQKKLTLCSNFSISKSVFCISTIVSIFFNFYQVRRRFVFPLLIIQGFPRVK